MGLLKSATALSYDDYCTRHVQVVFTRKMQQRQIFMEELKEVRLQRQKRLFKIIRDSIGPRWYQALSVPQRCALDTLEVSIYQDILEGRPTRTSKIIYTLGVHPRPKKMDLMHCVYVGREDPKATLALLYYMYYRLQIDVKRVSYALSARLILSAILYLGLDNLIELLTIRFTPNAIEEPPKNKIKRKIEPPLKSPYLQKLVAALYQPKRHKRPPPAPLPNLDDLNNEPFEDIPAISKPPPPPPPPPPPKKRLAVSYCDKIAGYSKMEPYVGGNVPAIQPAKKIGSHLKKTKPKFGVGDNAEKKFGMGSSFRKPTKKKLVAPTTGLENAQYLILGVYTINEKTGFILGSISVTPTDADLIHGGHRYLNGEYINIHNGYRLRPPEEQPNPCDCFKKWHDSIFKYLDSTKCVCSHNYDFGNEGNYPPDEPKFFEKPTRFTPLMFNQHTIFEMNPKLLLVEKEFKKAWDNDSALNDGAMTAEKVKKSKKKKSSKTCLGEFPKPEDYLKCALRLMGHVNIAARLPDIHMVPELKEWMRHRLYGPYTRHQKSEMLDKSYVYWTLLKSLESKGFGHVFPPKEPKYMGLTTWAHKQKLSDTFKTFTRQYKRALFKSYCNLNNLLWPTMCQPQLPDKKFREIYFSYLVWKYDDLHLMQPYSPRLSEERKVLLNSSKRYRCIPKLCQDLENGN